MSKKINHSDIVKFITTSSEMSGNFYPWQVKAIEYLVAQAVKTCAEKELSNIATGASASLSGDDAQKAIDISANIIRNARQIGKSKTRDFYHKVWCGVDPSADFLKENNMTAERFQELHLNIWKSNTEDRYLSKEFINKMTGADIKADTITAEDLVLIDSRRYSPNLIDRIYIEPAKVMHYHDESEPLRPFQKKALEHAISTARGIQRKNISGTIKCTLKPANKENKEFIQSLSGNTSKRRIHIDSFLPVDDRSPYCQPKFEGGFTAWLSNVNINKDITYYSKKYRSACEELRISTGREF